MPDHVMVSGRTLGAGSPSSRHAEGVRTPPTGGRGGNARATRAVSKTAGGLGLPAIAYVVFLAAYLRR